jgi:hypothetical protein
MYLTGHKEILKDVLATFRYYFSGLRFPNVNPRMLFKGMSYPDIPCGKYEIRDNDHVVMSKKQTCNIIKLYKVIGDFHQFKEIFQSHRGVYSFLHAMTINPATKVKDIVSTISTHATAYMFMSIYDNNYFDTSKGPSPNIFWVGVVMHIITDSYSQSHTMRLVDRRITLPVRDKTVPFVKFMMRLNKILFKALDRKVLYTKEELERILLQKYKTDATVKLYVNTKMKEIYKAYRMYMFEKQTIEVTQKLVGQSPEPASDRKLYDIYNFQFYNNQSSMYHKRKDMLTQIKKYPQLYERMHNECREILRMYKECLTNIAAQPHDHINITKTFLTNVYHYLLNNTFRVASKDWNNKTGYVYQD